MADLVRTLTSHLKLVGVVVAVVALGGGTATTISLADSSTPTPGPSSTPHANPHATAKPGTTKAKEKDDPDEKDEPKGVRPTDTHGYCVSHAVAAAKAKGATGRAIAAAAHSCPKHAKGKAKGHS